MAFLIIPEIKEMINKISFFKKKTENKIQKRYYQSVLKELQKTLEMLEEEKREKDK